MLRLLWSSQRQGIGVDRTGKRGTGVGAKVVPQAGAAGTERRQSGNGTTEVDLAALCVLGDGK